MDQRTTISPEVAAKQRTRSSVLFRLFDYLLGPLAVRLKHRYLMRKWAHHADARSIDWKWGETNFNRIAAVNLLLSKFEDPAYLEIGCASNTLFDSVPVSRKVGVDPASGGTVRATSDEFFAGNKDTFDVVFIDGLHTYEQVRRDVINAIGSINEGGWIALHDMLPCNWVEQHVPVVSNGAWTGDVWKVAFELLETDGLEFRILKIDNGVGVIKVVDRDATLKDLRSELVHQEFSYYYDNLDRLPITSWEDVQQWLHS